MMIPLLTSLGLSCSNGPRLPPLPEVPRLRTPAWNRPGTLHLRRDPADLAGLLLAHTSSAVVYRFLPTETRLKAVEREYWNRSDLEKDCAQSANPDPRRFRIDSRTKSLLAGARPVATAGRLPLQLAESPTREWLAVLSADGSPRGTLLPFVGRPAASGPHYHQVLREADGHPVGPPRRIPLDSSKDLLALCWSADERYVVYSDSQFTALVVVPFGVRGGKER